MKIYKSFSPKELSYVALPFVCTALLLTVIQAPIGLAPLAWLAWVPFIVACSPEARPRRLFLFGYIISLCYWLGNLYWVAPVTIAGWLVFCLYTALLWPVLALCLRWCRKKKVPLFLAAAVLIVGIERLQGFFLGGFFWRFLAHSQYRNTTLIQIVDIFGAGGVSFLIAMVNGLLAGLILAARQKKILTSVQFANTAIVCAAVVGAFVYGRWRISQEAECVTAGPLAASLQSNVPQSVKRTFESGDDLFTGLMEHSKVAAQAGAELIVWPETMVQAALNPEVLGLLESSHQWRVYDDALRQHAKDTAFLLVGAYGGTPVIQDDMSIQLGKKYNSAFMYKKNGDKAREVYNKIHLVPFGEVLPLRRSLSWFYELLMKIKFIPYNFDYSLDYGSEYTIFEMTGSENEQAQVYKFGVIICYEDTVPEIGRKFALDEHGEKRLDWLVNISNDGWFVRFKDEQVRPSAELTQHAAVCAFRAVENRLAVLRSVNTGISCLIDSAGRIKNGFTAGSLPRKARARTGMPGWFIDKIPIDDRVTFFSKYGEWLDFCCELCVIVLIIVLLSGKFFRVKKLVYQG
ncbi:MAG TPA: apolipoprotein N-acyltransferase [Phycisphaerales bacterium]|nr:apolipoprotein N-acyltransferase [Phycisphaerales bacterium]